MSWIARLMRRWGFVRLSDYGLAVAPDGTLVPLANATPEMAARVAPELDPHAAQLPASNFDVSRLIGEPAKLLEEGAEAQARPRRPSMLMLAAEGEAETEGSEADAQATEQAPVQQAQAAEQQEHAAEQQEHAAEQQEQAMPLRAAAPAATPRAQRIDETPADSKRGEEQPEDEARWEAMLAEARARAAAEEERARATDDEPQTEADWEAVIAAAKNQSDSEDDLEYMSSDELTALDDLEALEAEDDEAEIAQTIDRSNADPEAEDETDWEQMLERAKERSETQLQTPVLSADAEQSATDAGWDEPTTTEPTTTESSDSTLATALDNIAIGDTTQVTCKSDSDEWESKLAEIQARSEREEERRRRAAREAQRLSRRATPAHTTRTLQSMVSRSNTARRNRMAVGTEPPPRMSTTPGLGAGDATRVMRKRAPATPAAARPTLKPSGATSSPLPRLTTRLGGGK